METKCFEIRDRMTFIPVMATKLIARDEVERWMLRKCGYGPLNTNIILTRLNEGTSHVDPYDWGGRTLPVAHNYILGHFDKLESGAVIDVEFILGESKEQKISERLG